VKAREKGRKKPFALSQLKGRRGEYKSPENKRKRKVTWETDRKKETSRVPKRKGKSGWEPARERE